MKKPLSETNPHLKDKKSREKLIARSVRTSGGVEGIKFKAPSIDKTIKKAERADMIAWSKTGADSKGIKLGKELIKITLISNNVAIYCTFDIDSLIQQLESQRKLLKIGMKND